MIQKLLTLDTQHRRPYLIIIRHPSPAPVEVGDLQKMGVMLFTLSGRECPSCVGILPNVLAAEIAERPTVFIANTRSDGLEKEETDETLGLEGPHFEVDARVKLHGCAAAHDEAQLIDRSVAVKAFHDDRQNLIRKVS